MSDPFGNRPFPRAALIGAAALIVLSIGAAALGRLENIGTTRMPVAAIVQQRHVQFMDRSDGGILVYDTGSHQRIALLPPGSNGFLRGVLRALVRERRGSDIDSQAPFVLTRWADGRLSITDPTINRQINLEVFGPTNSAVFAQLLLAPENRS